VDAGSNLTGAWIVWMELLLKLVILCQYNSQIHRVPAGRIVTKQTNNKGHQHEFVYLKKVETVYVQQLSAVSFFKEPL
jgi:hypothetical protein